VGPLLTFDVLARLITARQAGESTIACSMDLEKSRTTVELRADTWRWNGGAYPYLADCKQRTIYYWDNGRFKAASRFSRSLIKLVPTLWGPPTFEIDGIKMLPTAQVSPYADAERKVGLIEPGGKRILDTCGGLGYFAAWCVQGSAAHVQSYEVNPDVIWLRSLNPWSPDHRWSAQPIKDLTLINDDITKRIVMLPDRTYDAILHDPPRFGIAGELYSQEFYRQLARVIRRRGRLFHYTGSPNKLTTARSVPNEVAARLRRAGFEVEFSGDGLLARKTGR
jgi:predicted methyltransferase